MLRSVEKLRHGMTTSLADVIGGTLQLVLCVVFMLVVTTGSIYDQIDETMAGVRRGSFCSPPHPSFSLFFGLGSCFPGWVWRSRGHAV